MVFKENKENDAKYGRGLGSSNRQDILKNPFTSYQSLYASNGKILAIDGLPEGDYPKEVDFVFEWQK